MAQTAENDEESRNAGVIRSSPTGLLINGSANYSELKQ
jgi:hypothetical protein